MCTLMYPGCFYSCAPILAGLSKEEKQKVIGPHSQDVLDKFNRDFGITDRRWEGLSRNLVVPNTKEEHWGTEEDTYEPQPGKIKIEFFMDFIHYYF
jgi:hypothetical protein